MCAFFGCQWEEVGFSSLWISDSLEAIGGCLWSLWMWKFLLETVANKYLQLQLHRYSLKHKKESLLVGNRTENPLIFNLDKTNIPESLIINNLLDWDDLYYLSFLGYH